MPETLADMMAAARAIDAAAEAAQPAPTPTPAAKPPDAAPAAGGASDGHGESLEALETRLRNAWADRQLADANMARDEALCREALAQRGIRMQPNPDSTPNADPAPTRLDGTPWTAADVRLAQELQRYMPGIDLLGARTPPGFRR